MYWYFVLYIIASCILHLCWWCPCRLIKRMVRMVLVSDSHVSQLESCHGFFTSTFVLPQNYIPFFAWQLPIKASQTAHCSEYSNWIVKSQNHESLNHMSHMRSYNDNSTAYQIVSNHGLLMAGNAQTMWCISMFPCVNPALVAPDASWLFHAGARRRCSIWLGPGAAWCPLFVECMWGCRSFILCNICSVYTLLDPL